MKRLRVLLAEDNRAVARQLRVILSQEFDVLGMVEDGDSLIRAATDMQPDVVVTDISMPGMDGMEAAEYLLRERAGLFVVFITVHADPQLVARAMGLGNCGYVLKSDAGEDLIPAVNAVTAGQCFVSGAIAYP